MRRLALAIALRDGVVRWTGRGDQLSFWGQAASDSGSATPGWVNLSPSLYVSELHPISSSVKWQNSITSCIPFLSLLEQITTNVAG